MTEKITPPSDPVTDCRPIGYGAARTSRAPAARRPAPPGKKVLAFVLLCLAAASAAYGQTNLETNAGVQFNFSSPGAGSLALGGAFLALADDATAAYTNPAGLTNILDPEFHLEVRAWTYTHVFTDRGRLVGRVPTGNNDFDTIAGLQDAEAENDVEGVSFFSYVYPRKNWSFAVYRHELASFEANFSTQGAFLELTRARSPLGFPAVDDGRLASLRNRMSLDIVNHGFSAAYRLGPRLSLGLGLSFFDFSLTSSAERFLPDLFDPPDFNDGNQRTGEQRQDGDDSDWGLTGGFLWQSRRQTWSLGGVYRQGPEFDLTAISESRPPPEEIMIEPAEPQNARFNVPDVFGAGIAFKPNDAVRITFDYDRIEYSALVRDIVDIFQISRFETESFKIGPELDGFKIDDADELHLGFEYALYRLRTPILLRLGAWHDPDHSLRFEGENQGLRAVYRRRGDQMHYSFGVGLSRRTFQIDAAFDYSERVSTVSLSAVFRYREKRKI